MEWEEPALAEGVLCTNFANENVGNFHSNVQEGTMVFMLYAWDLDEKIRTISFKKTEYEKTFTFNLHDVVANSSKCGK